MVGLFIRLAFCLQCYCKIWQVNEGGEATSFDKVQAHQMAKKQRISDKIQVKQTKGLGSIWFFCLWTCLENWKHSGMIVFLFFRG